MDRRCSHPPVPCLAEVTVEPPEPAPHLPVFLSVVTSTLIAALLLTVSGVMISEYPRIPSSPDLLHRCGRRREHKIRCQEGNV